jgi:hypothetical protein
MAQYDSEDKNKAIVTKLDAKAARNKAYKETPAYKAKVKAVSYLRGSQIDTFKPKKDTPSGTLNKEISARDRARKTDLANKGGSVANLSPGEQRTRGRANKAALKAALNKKKK